MTLYTANPSACAAPRRQEIEAAIAGVIADNRYILGPQVQAFEERFAGYCEVGHAIGVASGTDALSLALIAAGVGTGDEVITVSHTAVATAAAIARIGAVPVFVDTEADYYTLDPKALENAVGATTKAIVPVHLFGHAADMDPILAIAAEHGLAVVEDCAQAHGARYKGRRVGSMGDFGCFSFYPTKNLAAIGDGGAVTTNNAQLAEKLRRLREYGWDASRNSQEVGLNSRLDELQAAILIVNLKYLDEDTARRREIAARYDDALAVAGLTLPRTREGCAHVYHLYVVADDDRDVLMAHLKANDILAGVHYSVPVHLQPAYRGYRQRPLPTTEAAARRILSLPMYPAMSDDDVSKVLNVIGAWERKRSS